MKDTKMYLHPHYYSDYRTHTQRNENKYKQQLSSHAILNTPPSNEQLYKLDI